MKTAISFEWPVNICHITRRDIFVFVRKDKLVVALLLGRVSASRNSILTKQVD